MRTAKSARMLGILGASLVANMAPGLGIAAIDSGSTEAIDSGSTEAIDSGSTEAIDSGSTNAIDTGAILAIDTGASQAIDTGAILAIDTGAGQAIDTGAILAIDTGAGQAIDTGAILAIDTGAGQAIDTGAILAIDTGAGQAIDTGAILAIDTGAGQAIDTGAILAIDTGAGQAIDTGAILAIDTGAGQAIDTGAIVAIDTGAGQAIDSGASPLLGGPIQSINASSGTFVSVGQTVVFDGDNFGALRVGDYVVVSGSIAGAGVIVADRVQVSSELYVAGATEVFVTGIPSSVDFAAGTARIGDLTVDYTPSLGRAGFRGIGAAITAIGTQPVLGGTMLSERVVDMTELFLRDAARR